MELTGRNGEQGKSGSPGKVGETGDDGLDGNQGIPGIKPIIIREKPLDPTSKRTFILMVNHTMIILIN